MEPHDQPDAHALAKQSLGAPEDPQTTQAVEEYRALLRAGRKPDRREFLARHPQAAGTLAECLDALEFIHSAAPQVQALVLASPTTLEPEAALGDFRIVREVGRGGMGVVYEAVQVSLGRRVALKVLPFAAALDARPLQRFRNEAQAAARLHHTHIVPVHAVGCERGTHFYAMQFIDGQPLSAVIAELRRNVECRMTNDERRTNDQCPMTKPPVPSADAQTDVRHSTLDIFSSLGIGHSSFFQTVARFGLQAALALEHAHQLGVVHRDIKPDNLLVDGQGNLWITDFGLARLKGEAGLTVTGDLVGTLRYMSPEQALGRRELVDPRTDIYSLGVTLYELLTLEPAVPGGDRQEVLRRLEREEPRRPRRLNRAIPPELETILSKAIAKDPAERYATAQELADDLQRFLEDKAIRARRPTLRQIMLKWARRHRAVVATAAIALLASLILGMVGLVATNRRIGLEQERTEAARRRAERNVALAMQALDHLYLRLAEQRFPQDPGRERENRDLLALALVFYQEVASDNSADPAVQEEVARACRRVGDIQRILGHVAEARQAYDRALTLAGQLAAAFPERPDYRVLLAEIQCNLGAMSADQGDRPAARDYFRRALDLRERLVAESPHRADFQFQLGDTQHDLSLLLKDQGEFAHARRLLEQAIASQEAALRHEPEVPAYRRSLANDYAALAELVVLLGDGVRAKQLYDQALRIYQRLTADFPDASLYREELALCRNNFGALLSDGGEQAAAEHLQEALRLFTGLATDFPTVPRYRHELAKCRTNLGKTLLERGRFPQAAEQFDQAIALLTPLAADPASLPAYRQDLAGTHNNRGNVLAATGDWAAALEHNRRALSLLDRLAADFPMVPQYRRQLAVSHYNLGSHLRQSGQRAAAGEHLHAALAIQEKLAAEFPAVPQYRHDLAHSHITLGVLSVEGAARAAADKHYRQAVAILSQLTADFPKLPAYRSDLALGHNNLGVLLREDGAIAAAEQHFRRAFDLQTSLATDFPNVGRYREELERGHKNLAVLLKNRAQPGPGRPPDKGTPDP